MSAAEFTVGESQPTMHDLLSHLSERGLIDGSQREAAQDVLAGEAESTPLIVQILTGAGAWIACLCIVMVLFEDGTPAIISGSVLAGAAAFLHRHRTGVFSEQFSLATVMTGVLMITLGFESGPDLLSMGIAAAVAAAVLYVPFNSAIFRFMSVSFGLYMLSIGIEDLFGEEWLHGMILLETIGVGLIFTKFPQSSLRPLGYAMAGAMLATLLVTLVDHMSVWPAVVIQICAHLWLLNFAMSTNHRRVPWILGLSAAAAGLLGLLSAPGILAAIGVILLGHLERDDLLRSLGLLFLPVYLVAFYYNLDTSLLAKSGILISSGAILWAARWYISERIQAGLFKTAVTGEAS